MDKLWWTAIIGAALANAVLFMSASMSEHLAQPYTNWELRTQIQN